MRCWNTRSQASESAVGNGDGIVNCADLALIQAALNTGFGQLGFDSRADLNHDGFVNSLDLNLFNQLLPAGTVCN
jgi:hypothetical protein